MREGCGLAAILPAGEGEWFGGGGGMGGVVKGL